VKQGEFVSEFSAEKVCYFLQKFGGEKYFKLKFAPNFYGPYSGKVRYVLNYLNGSYLIGYSDLNKKPFEPLLLISDGYADVQQFVESRQELFEIAKQTTKFIDGFCSDFALQLLSTVDWIMREKETNDIMSKITDSFFKLYTAENILKWNGNLLEFAPFKKIIDKTIKGEDVSNLISENLALLKDDIQREKEIFVYSVSGLKNQILGLYLEQKSGVDTEYVKTLNEEIIKDLRVEMRNANGSVREMIFPLPNSSYLAYTTSFSVSPEILAKKIE
jgi:hypothetical protein